MDEIVRGKKRCHFFDWCGTVGLDSNVAISLAFSISTQTVRNWREDADRPLKPWVWLACDGYEVCLRAMSISGQPLPALPRVTVEGFGEWMMRNKFRTYEEAGKAMGLTRQAVHNWIRRNRFPNWLALACVGVERSRRKMSNPQVVAALWALQPGNMGG